MKWCAYVDELIPKPSDRVIDWLAKPYSLKDALSRVYPDLQLTVLHADFAVPLEDEQAKLAVSDACFIRIVMIRNNSKPLLYARTVIPASTYLTFEKEFTDLKNRFIGEHLLYPREDMQRSAFEYAAIDSRYPEFAEINRLTRLSAHASLWARRSLFLLSEHPLLVSECYLPTVFEHACTV